MRLKKRGISLLSPEVLLRVILGVMGILVVFTVVDTIANHVTATAETTNLVQSRMAALDGSTTSRTSVSLDINENSAMLIFPKGNKTIFGYIYIPNPTQQSNYDPKTGTLIGTGLIKADIMEFNRPNACPLETNCILLCKDIEEDESSQWRNPSTAQLEYSIDQYSCGQVMQIKKYENSNFYFKPESWYFLMPDMTPGFVKTKDTKKLGTLHIEKFKDTYGFCLEFPCISDDKKAMIEYGDSWQAALAVKAFTKDLTEKCKAGDITNSFSLVVPDKHEIVLGKLPSMQDEQEMIIMSSMGFELCEKPPKAKTVKAGTTLHFEVTKQDDRNCCLKETGGP